MPAQRGCDKARIARWYNVAINSVCGRVNELIERGFLIEIGSKKDVISGCSTSILKPTERIA
nr:MAG TPA: Double-stranded RNA-specific adenosine deaminase [Caudoviricetes sp.]